MPCSVSASARTDPGLRNRVPAKSALFRGRVKLVRSRLRSISEGEDTGSLGRFQSYKRGFLVELPASASIDQRIEIEDAIKKHDFIEASMFYEDMHWKLDVKGGPPIYVYFRNTTKSTVEPVNFLQSTNQSIPKDRSFSHPVFRHPSYNNVFHSLQEGIMSLKNVCFFHFIVLLNRPTDLPFSMKIEQNH